MRLVEGVEVLWLPGSRVQLGVDGGAVRLEGLRPRQLHCLESMTRVHVDPGRAAQRLGPALLARLRRAGLLVSGTDTALPGPSLAVEQGLRRGGLPLGRVAQRHLDVVSVWGQAGLVNPVVEALSQARVGNLLTPQNASGAGLTDAEFAQVPSAQLAIVLGRHLVDWWTCEQLLRSDQVFLPVEVGDDSLRVGPLVVPGSSPCYRCLHLARLDQDPDWAVVACQLASQRLPAPPAQVTALTAAVVTQVALTFITWPTSPKPGQLANQVLEWTLDAPLPHTRAVAPHPQCGCGATGKFWVA
ncbi:MAG: TOMM precursor leader peptide-binding protein [Buchananella hordeovulneris]|nr:TOMM precursor leader peptide-binding protein [Buchananella hordeovulneris]